METPESVFKYLSDYLSHAPPLWSKSHIRRDKVLQLYRVQVDHQVVAGVLCQSLDFTYTRMVLEFYADLRTLFVKVFAYRLVVL